MTRAEELRIRLHEIASDIEEKIESGESSHCTIVPNLVPEGFAAFERRLECIGIKAKFISIGHGLSRLDLTWEAAA